MNRRALLQGLLGASAALILPPSVAEGAEAGRRWWSLGSVPKVDTGYLETGWFDMGMPPALYPPPMPQLGPFMSKEEQVIYYAIAQVTGSDRHMTVPPRYILGLTSFLQTAIVETIWEALADDSGRATRIALAWNKMLMIQLEMMLKSIAPYWPDWDERPSVTRELYAAAI